MSGYASAPSPLIASGMVITSAGLAATDSQPIYIARSAVKVIGLSFFTKTGIAASDVNFWAIQIRKRSGGATLVIAQKTTQVTGGEAIGATDWNFDSIPFDPANQILAKGDALDLAFLRTGAPTNLAYLAYSVNLTAL